MMVWINPVKLQRHKIEDICIMLNCPWSNRKITVISITNWKHFENIFFNWGSTSIQVRVIKAEDKWTNEAKQNNTNIHWNSAGSLWCFWNCMNNNYQCFIHFRYNNNSLRINQYRLVIFYSNRKRSVWLF